MKKTVGLLVTILLSAIMVCGCGGDAEPSDSMALNDDTYIDVVDDITLDKSSVDINEVDNNITDDTAALPTPEQQQPAQDVPRVNPYTELVDLSDRMASGYIRLDDLGEVCDYVNEQVSIGNMTMEFVYSPGAEGLDATQLAWISSKMSITYSYLNDVPNAMRLTVHLYPGDKIANAYLTGDSSALTADEKQVLAIATEVVEDAKATAKSELELEKILHDWVCERITYYDEPDGREVGDLNNPTRFLTAVGGVLDQKANCQGFSDTFYMLATMAGFRVNRMSAYTETDTHMFNIIYVNGGWYILDTTFDDKMFEDGRQQTVYMSFNTGIDRRGDLMWEEEMQYLPIKEVSDENFYYLASADLTGVDYKMWQDSIDEAVDTVIDQWRNNGRATIQVYVPDANDADGEKFFGKLQSELKSLDIAYSYSGGTFPDGPDMLYEVVFK